MESENLAEKSVEKDGCESISGESMMDSVQGSGSMSRSSSDHSCFGRSVWVRGDAPSCVSVGSGKGGSCLSSEDDSLLKQTDKASELEMMKERFAKLLLGEDMSGGGEGVCSALTISNAVTNLCATVFGQLWRLEPLASGKKAMWQREMKWLLSVSDFIIEFVPTLQTFPDGGTLEVMTCRPRSDLAINLPALCKLDNMLLEVLDGFADTEFWYVDQGIVAATPETDGSGKSTPREKEKWWLPLPRVPPDGLSESTRKKLCHKRESTSQILKAASSINSAVLSEMEVPASYLETLPKTGRACLGEVIYRYFTSEGFSPECLLDCLDPASEHAALEIANRLEAAIYVLWRRQHPEAAPEMQQNRSSSSWGLLQDFMMNGVKGKALAERAEGLLHCLKQRFPNLSQSNLDIIKIQCNKDVGKAILESYSRVLESLAFSIVARIEDVLYVDDISRKPEKVLLSVTQVNKKNSSSDTVPGSGTPTKSFSSKPPRPGFGVKKALTSYLSHDTKAKIIS